MSTSTTTQIGVPAAGTYGIDASHSHVGFKVRHLVVGKTRGRFTEVDVTAVVAEDPTASTLEVTVPLASVDTRDVGRDEHLRSADFFDVEKHPNMTFRSTAVTPVGGDRWDVAGELTVRGVTRPLTLHASFEGGVSDPWGNDRAAFTATAELDRESFGLTWNQALETGGVLVGKKIDIEIEAELVRAKA
ncbi:MAG: YceI family protein [Actinomycetota bacterium]|nr:YceI family protein [Actinomycetota bacterium]